MDPALDVLRGFFYICFADVAGATGVSTNVNRASVRCGWCILRFCALGTQSHYGFLFGIEEVRGLVGLGNEEDTAEGPDYGQETFDYVEPGTVSGDTMRLTWG